MTLNKANIAIAIILAWVTLQGCGTTLESDMSADWESSVSMDYLSTAYVMNDGSRIVIGNDNNIYILDGETGEIVERMEESFWEGVARRMQIEVAGMRVDGAIAEAYTLVPLEEMGTMLLFDYRFEEETMLALDSETGENLWQNDELAYSIFKYSDLIDAAVDQAASAMAGALGGTAQTESTYEQRQRENAFMNSIVHEVPESDHFLLKSFEGLHLMDGRDGTELWNVPEFEGPGIADMAQLPDGDFLVLSRGEDLLNLEMASSYHVARISQEEELRWLSEHSATRISAVHATENHVVVDGAPTEVFDISTGEKLWENEVIKGSRAHAMLVTDNNLYMAGDLEASTVQVGVAGWVWEHDLDTGDVIWKTEETSTEFMSLTLVDDILLARGDGDKFGGNGGVLALDSQTGDELWITPEMEPFGWRGVVQQGVYYGTKVTEPFIYEDDLFVAGPDNFYAIDLHSGDLLFDDVHDEHDTGGVNGLVMHQDRIILVGRDAVVGYNRDDGSVDFVTETETTSSFSVHENHLVLWDGRERAGALDLVSGELGPMMRTESSGGTFGVFSGSVFVSEDGTHVYSIDEDRVIRRHQLH